LRNEPVRREEVRIVWQWRRDQIFHQVATMPLGTYTAETRSKGSKVTWTEQWFVGVAGLWQPLWDSLAAELEAKYSRQLRDYQTIPEMRVFGPPRLHVLAPAPELEGSFSNLIYACEYVCEHCGRRYLGVKLKGNRRVSTCSDHCEHERCKAVERRWRKDAGITTSNALRTARRAEVRAGRVCEHCGVPIEAARSTKRFCSDICRVRHSRREAAG
jgi:hypothetical protein